MPGFDLAVPQRLKCSDRCMVNSDAVVSTIWTGSISEFCSGTAVETSITLERVASGNSMLEEVQPALYRCQTLRASDVGLLCAYNITHLVCCGEIIPPWLRDFSCALVDPEGIS